MNPNFTDVKHLIPELPTCWGGDREINIPEQAV